MNAILIATVIATGQVHVQGFSNIADCWNHMQQHSTSTTHTFECVPAPASVNNFVTANYYDTVRLIDLVKNLTGKIINE